MPRVSRAQAESHREAITDASARLFKERGLKSVSVADLMGAAGLTHGGFYGHFESKDALAGVAATHAFAQSAERWRVRLAALPDAATRRAALVGAYLKPQSVSDVGGGCPTVSLAADVAREPADAPIRQAYADGVASLLALLAQTEDTGDAAADRAAALADYATMVGALTIARATAGTALSDELLAAARARLGLPPAAAEASSDAPKRAPARRTPRSKTSPKA